MKKYPALYKILSEKSEFVSFREKPEVEVSCWTYFEDGSLKFDCDESSLRLLLPTITRQEYESLPESFKLHVPYYFQDESGSGSWLYFDFIVKVKGANFFDTGEVELKTEHELIDFSHD